MTPRTVASHLTARNNFRQRHYAALSERARAAREAWREQRFELTPTEKGRNLMAIFDSWGNEVELLRVENGVVEVRYTNGDTEVLDESELKADGGWHEISAVIETMRTAHS